MRQELARQYLTWARTVVPGIAGVALFLIWLAYAGDGILRASIVAIASSLVAVALVVVARRVDYVTVVRVSVYVDIVLISLFVIQFDDVSVFAVTYMWTVVVAAAFATPRDMLLVTTSCVLLSIGLPFMTGDPDGAQVFVESLMLAVVGTIVCVLGIDATRVVRERRSLERQLQDAQRLARIGSFDFDPATDHARWSDEMHRIFQVPDGEPLGVTAFIDAVVEADRERVGQALQEGVESGQGTSFDTTIRRGDGELRAVHVIGRGVDSDDGFRIVGSVQDVTDLRRLDAMRDEFVAAASHELRTPTSIVLGFATTLTAEWDNLPDVDRRRFVDEIEDAAMRLSLLIEDVLQVTQIESGNVHCLLEPFDLRAEVEDLVRTWPGSSTVELADTAAEAPIRALGDVTRTRQVLVNLLENAERHARDAEKPVRISVDDDGERVIARVSDHGPGIPVEAHEQIFGRFVRLGSDSTGTGLGLYISRRLAEAQGGTLEVDSVPGRGATFTFALPAYPGRGPL